MMRQMLTEAIEAQYTDRPDLLPKVVPQYPPAAKRIIVDNGAWAQMLHRDNVDAHRHRRSRGSSRRASSRSTASCTSSTC